MSDTIVRIADRARAVLAFDAELQALNVRIAEERARHSRVLAEEAALHDRNIESLRTQQQALEQAIFRLGAN